MEKIHIEKGSVQETLIVPLYARKLCAEQFPSLYQDEYAAMICGRRLPLFHYGTDQEEAAHSELHCGQNPRKKYL